MTVTEEAVRKDVHYRQIVTQKTYEYPETVVKQPKYVAIVPVPVSLINWYDVHSADHVGRVVYFSLDLSMYVFSEHGPGIPVLGYCPFFVKAPYRVWFHNRRPLEPVS